ncbi:MAG: dTMP kinase [Bdellovibrionota bacterium]
MYFIAFEGLDGSGKSSLMHLLNQELHKLGFQTVLTREPGGTELGDSLRELILKKDGVPPSPRAELLMYEASRAQHVEKIIKPALADQKWVLCDRFTGSSVAFQCGGRSISRGQVDWLNDFAVNGCNPHLNVLLDLPVDQSKVRREQRQTATGIKHDRMESEPDDFHERVRESFLAQARENPEQWLIVSSLEKPEQLLQHLLKHLKMEKKWLGS